jgi:hypothetical protein
MRIGEGNVEAMDQEFESASPNNFHQVLAHYLRTQKVIFRLLPRLFPGLDADTKLSDQLEIYETVDQRSWDTLERKYATEIRAAHAQAAPPAGAN